MTKSSTRGIPDASHTPQHVAIIMDGNGRWAKRRFLPRIAGHKRGVDSVRTTITACLERGIRHLTVFAFSSENWRRPADEVSFLMSLFLKSLEGEISRMHQSGIRFRVVGDVSQFDAPLLGLIRRSEALTHDNDRLTFTVAANYGGRWDVLHAVNAMAVAHPDKAGCYTEDDLRPFLCLGDVPEPDLFIRTGGEQRISNFLLWQLAYTELYFTPLLWPEFDAAALDVAIESYRKRERRFGRTSEQLVSDQPAHASSGGSAHA